MLNRSSHAAQAGQPNILWLVSEDNNPFIGAYGDRLAHTPNIDALAQRGLLYRNVFCAAPVCAPSRFAILTGVHPESCAPANHMRANATLPDVLQTYPEHLRQAGYYCTNNDKTDWNCDAEANVIFDAQGKNAHWKSRPPGQPFMAVFNTMTTHESCLFLPGIEGPAQPEAMRVPAYLPDTPEIRSDRTQYYNAITKMDAEVGAWIKEVEDAGLAEDTIIFYYSDNGGSLPRSKRYCTDAGLRCALVVYVPPKWAHLASMPMGTEIESPISLIDLPPTLLSLANIAPPAAMHGTPFLGTYARSRGDYAFGMRNRMDERYDFVRAVTNGRFHYIRNYTLYRPIGQHGAFEWATKGYQSWEREYLAGRLSPVQSRFFDEERSFEELYDLENDPDQITNLGGEDAYTEILSTLRDVVNQHMLTVNDNGFIPEGMEIEGYLPSQDQEAYPLPRLMELGAMAAQRDRVNLPSLIEQLDDSNDVVRHWAILGILMLGAAGATAQEKLSAIMQDDPIPQNQLVAAEAIARLAPSPEAVALLAHILDTASSWSVQLQALNSLTFIGVQAKDALPAIQRAAESNQEYLRSAGRYLVAVLEGRYEPSYPVLELERLREEVGL